MRITIDQPYAGRTLTIGLILDYEGRASVSVTIDQMQLFDRMFTCPDPPCHEAVTIDVPMTARGSTLTVEGRDAGGPQRATRGIL
jgi:hypothetical protein